MYYLIADNSKHAQIALSIVAPIYASHKLAQALRPIKEPVPLTIFIVMASVLQTKDKSELTTRPLIMVLANS